MEKKLLEIAADMVKAQVSSGGMSSDDIGLALARTFMTLQRMQKAEEHGLQLDLSKPSQESSPESKAPEKIDPKDSIQKDKIICLECNAQMKQLTANHLKSHGLSSREYRKKWGFSLGQPLSAKALTKARSKAAKKRGLPEKLAKYIEARRQKKAEAALPETQPTTSKKKKGVKAPAKRTSKKKAST
jgi:predicted transcriptional regulator